MALDCVWNVMAHAQKPDFPFKLAVASFQSTAGSWGVHISGSNAGYTMFWGSVEILGSCDRASWT